MKRNRNGTIEGRNFTGKCRLSLNPIFLSHFKRFFKWKSHCKAKNMLLLICTKQFNENTQQHG